METKKDERGSIKGKEVDRGIKELEKRVLKNQRWDTWHVGGVREHLRV